MYTSAIDTTWQLFDPSSEISNLQAFLFFLFSLAWVLIKKSWDDQMRTFFCCICLLFFSLHGEEPKICLTMMVKNDEAVISRCLQSVKNIIDCISICNVGSTDETISIIKSFMLEQGLPGIIYNHKWKNGGYNRTLLAQTAQETIKNLDLPLNNTYFLVLDPDDILQVTPSFKKGSLQANSYLLLERFSDFFYCQYRPHLLRANTLWKSNGVIHEYWSCHGSLPSEKLSSLKIDNLIDPEIKEAKLEDNLGILTEAVKSQPNSAYYIFYLAQTNHALGRYNEAIRWYKESSEKEEDKEKAWFSKFMIAECYEKMAQWDRALFWYLDTYQFNPNRAEPLQKISVYYRTRGQNDLAYIFAKHGSRIPFPTSSLIFPLSPLTNYHFDEELSVTAYYTRFKDEGFTASNDLILRKNVPDYLKANTHRNLLFYVENLNNTSFMPIDIELPLIVEGLEDKYNPMNPSIQKTDLGYKVICRTVNYTQQGAKTFHTVDPDGIFRTRNFLVHYTPDFKIVSQQEIIEDLPRDRIRTFSLEGLDDCRIFEYKNSSWFTCTTGDTNPFGNFQISLCKLDPSAPTKTVDVEKLTPLQGPDPYRCEKNWLPFVKNDELYAIYSCFPFTIYKPNPETGECTTALSYEPKYDFSSFRGGAAPIKFDGGYLMLVHEVVLFPDSSRCYLHRFLHLNDEFVVQKISKPFTFQHKGVEYCCSMTIDHSGTQLILPIGIEDREALLCFIDLQTVRSLLHELPALESTL